MTKIQYIRPNVLGDLRAEADNEMLSKAFIETADYRTLIETSDRSVIVGRRGTGKSALALKLQQHWSGARDVHVVKITPEEHQTIGIRPLIELFGDSFVRIRAGTRLVWRYVLMMETARCLSSKREFTKAEGYAFLREHVTAWGQVSRDVVDRYRETLRGAVDRSAKPEDRIGELPIRLDLTKVEEALGKACSECSATVVFLIDRLDEGYEPDDVGIGFIDGLLQAAIDLKTRIPRIKPAIFLRDNIFRAVQKLDPDYSRNIEGHVLRLHWDEESLFNFAAKRLRFAFNVPAEATLKVWNHCTAGDLKGRSGFAKCLHLTLYRPRDLLSLLNEAFYLAGKNGQSEIVMEHVETTGRTISQNRLDDLTKEYKSILPGLADFVAAFHGRNPELNVREVEALLESVLSNGSEDSVVQQEFFILENVQAVLRGLYSVGFLGIRDNTSGTFVFCHDGRAPDREFHDLDRVLIHPGYWMALNSTRNALDPNEAEEIFDEYDIEVSSETPNIRNSKIRELIAQLDRIEEGAAGSTAFEVWCQKAIRICFAKGLRNVELKANKLAKLRRDVVATNLGEGDAWRRIYDDYGVRQVTFEIKNYRGLEAADYQQVQSYLSGEYGRLAFIVCRDESVDLYSEKDVEWVREMYANHQVIIIKLTAKFLANLLDKLRNPQKHDAVNDAIHRLLDTYTRLYLAGQTAASDVRNRKRRHKQSRQKAQNVKRG